MPHITNTENSPPPFQKELTHRYGNTVYKGYYHSPGFFTYVRVKQTNDSDEEKKLPHPGLRGQYLFGTKK